MSVLKNRRAQILFVLSVLLITAIALPVYAQGPKHKGPPVIRPPELISSMTDTAKILHPNSTILMMMTMNMIFQQRPLVSFLRICLMLSNS